MNEIINNIKDLTFQGVNEWFWQLPELFHVITFAALIAVYAQLFFGFWMVRKRLARHIVVYFLGRTFILFSIIILKSNTHDWGLFDLFLPVYLFSYIDGLIVLNGFGIYRCQNMKQAGKKIMKFNSVKSKTMKANEPR